ncbi:MAG: putative NarL family two-component response regulator [Acidimicrobiales bacterium]|nr:putative NarL family two-component response regulator [Acidimicrobiales bacterium]
MAVRVVVVDDQALVRAGFRMILEAEPGIDVVGEAADGIEAVELVQRAMPDVVLMDIRMPRLDGVEATARIVDASDASDASDTAGTDGTDGTTPPKVLILTTFDLDEYVFAALRAGASGFLLKDTPAEALVEAVKVIAAGDALLDPSITRRVIEQFAGSTPPPRAAEIDLSSLTEREQEVLVLMARGLSNTEIATELYLGESTVKTHVGRVLMKLQLRDRVQAVVLAYESGLVQPGQ